MCNYSQHLTPDRAGHLSNSFFFAEEEKFKGIVLFIFHQIVSVKLIDVETNRLSHATFPMLGALR